MSSLVFDFMDDHFVICELHFLLPISWGSHFSIISAVTLYHSCRVPIFITITRSLNHQFGVILKSKILLFILKQAKTKIPIYLWNLVVSSVCLSTKDLTLTLRRCLLEAKTNGQLSTKGHLKSFIRIHWKYWVFSIWWAVVIYL